MVGRHCGSAVAKRSMGKRASNDGCYYKSV
jgi:hypothetical protein